MKNNLLLIDGHSLAYRAFYALPPMNSAEGFPTNVIHGFTKMLIRLVDKFQPVGLAVAFDTKVPTFRHIEYPEYKGHRPPSPPEFHPQIPLLKELLSQVGVKYFTLDGFEADDILATLATRGVTQGFEVEILTGDKDILQMVSEQITVLIPTKGLSEITEYRGHNFKELTGLTPLQIVDYKSLKGDASDNIKGVSGIGDKTATQLLQIYGSLEKLLATEHLELSPRIREKLAASTDMLKLNVRLTTLIRDVPLDDSASWQFSGVHLGDAVPLLKELDLKSLLKMAEVQGSFTCKTHETHETYEAHKTHSPHESNQPTTQSPLTTPSESGLTQLTLF